MDPIESANDKRPHDEVVVGASRDVTNDAGEPGAAVAANDAAVPAAALPIDAVETVAEADGAHAAGEPAHEWEPTLPSFEWISPREVLEPTVDVCVRYWPVLLGVSLLIAALGYGVVALAARIPKASIDTSQAVDMLPILVNAACMVPLVALLTMFTGVVSVVSLAARHGRPLSVLGALGLVVAQARGVLIVGIVAGAAVALASAWPGAFANQNARVPPGVPTPDPSLGLYLYCAVAMLLGAFLALRLAFTGPAEVLEGRGEGVVRSWDLTRSHPLTLLVVVLPLTLGALAFVGIVGSILRQMNVPNGVVDLVSIMLEAAALVFPVAAVTELYMLIHLRSSDYAPSPVLALLPGAPDGDGGEAAEEVLVLPVIAAEGSARQTDDVRETAFSVWYEARVAAPDRDAEGLRGAWMEAVNEGQAWVRRSTERPAAEGAPTE